jgi:transposase
MVTTIGIDPHKATHTAVAINETETVLGEITIPADRDQTKRLIDWASELDGDGRLWAVEAAGGLGFLLSQQLIADGEQVVDVPPVLASRVRLLGSGRSDKNDPNDARSVAIAALRQPGLAVVLREDHTQVLRMLAKRHLELTSLRTQAACRLHAVILQLRPGGITRRLSATKAARMLGSMRNLDPISEQRRTMARTHLGDIQRLDREIKTNKVSISKAVATSGTTVTDVYGVGPVVAALLIGYTANIGRFASADHYAAYNGTAPIEVSSGGKKRHRLSMRGNRVLNHAIHMAAVTQIGHDTPGRIYYNKKQAEGKTKKEALRTLKRRISNVVYQQLVADHQQTTSQGPGGSQERLLSLRGRPHILNTGSSAQPPQARPQTYTPAGIPGPFHASKTTT